MRFIFFLVAFAGLAMAQNSVIGLPTADQANSLTSSQEMAVATGLVSCPSRVCQPASNIIGSVVYNGLFDPVYHEAYLPPYQNFTITVPSSFAAGQAHINVAHTILMD
ncbi:hypothetical protein N7494_005177 [Penicillium frequentans]|uniref:Uncharacterized protein n=1 Tax=Penicillium frequentans TaxID=3151616 RepID=A0AAD6CXM1_9EURO|nr:hypothetical protein N7494_005177 [Penicillium glabrum]